MESARGQVNVFAILDGQEAHVKHVRTSPSALVHVCWTLYSICIS